MENQRIEQEKRKKDEKEPKNANKIEKKRKNKKNERKKNKQKDCQGRSAEREWKIQTYATWKYEKYHVELKNGTKKFFFSKQAVWHQTKGQSL